MKIFISILIVVLLVSPVLSREISGEISLLDKKDFVQGDVATIKIKLWPFEKTEMLNKRLINKKFLNLFYIINITDISISPNNSEVIIVTCKTVILKSFDPNGVLLWPLGEDTLSISFVGIEKPFEKFGRLGKQFIVQQLDSELVENKYLLFLILPLILIMLLHLIMKKKKINSALKSKSERKERLKMLENVSTREDLEKLWVERTEFYNTFNENRDDLQEAMDSIYSFQYMEKWSNERLEMLVNKVREVAIK